MIILGIESSCDETSCAIIQDGIILSNIIASQTEIHAAFGGVVPELASRHHMEMIIPVVQSALTKAGVTLSEIDGIAATRSPGLIGALLVGFSFGKAMAQCIGRPFVGVNHLEGHLHAPFLESPTLDYPFVALVVSGGHTSLYHVTDFGQYRLLGATRDDAAGEVYDKVAKCIGLGYPGGPIVDRLAHLGNPKRFHFTRPKIGPHPRFQIGEADFSFSGLKTAVRQKAMDLGDALADERTRNDLLASFQETAVDILCEAIEKACQSVDCKTVVISGGVACNKRLRQKLNTLSEQRGWKTHIPSPILCTDNAAMIAYVGWQRLLRGDTDPMTLTPLAIDELGLS